MTKLKLKFMMLVVLVMGTLISKFEIKKSKQFNKLYDEVYLGIEDKLEEVKQQLSIVEVKFWKI